VRVEPALQFTDLNGNELPLRVCREAREQWFSRQSLVSGLRAEHGYEVGTKAMSRSPQTTWLGRFRAYPSRTPGSPASPLLESVALGQMLAEPPIGGGSSRGSSPK
jgi:hypothetical protein